MAKSSKPRSTTTPRTTRTRKPAAAPETTTFEEKLFTTASLGAALETTTPPALPHDLIAMRAYELYLGDGAVPGRDVEHWLRAESELRARASRN